MYRSLLKASTLRFLSLFVLCLSHPNSALSEQKVVIGFDAGYPPFSYLNDAGEPAGIYTEILTQAFESVEGYDVEVRGYPWKRLMKLVEDGKILGAYPPYYWPDKRPWMSPYSEPVLTERVAVYCNRNSFAVSEIDSPVKWPESFYGLRIGNDSGFETPGPAFFEASRQGLIEVHEGSTLQNIKLLLLNRVDCYVNGELSIQHSVKSLVDKGMMVEESKALFKAFTIRENDGFIGYAQNATSFFYKADFVEKVDEAINAMKASGEINAILKRYEVQQ